MEKNADKRLMGKRLKAISTFGWSFAAGMTMLTLIGVWKGFPLAVVVVTAILALYHGMAFFFFRKGLVPSYEVMSRIGHGLAFVISMIVFFLVYYVIFSPVSFVLRLCGKDHIRGGGNPPFWVDMPEANNDPRRIEKMY